MLCFEKAAAQMYAHQASIAQMWGFRDVKVWTSTEGRFKHVIRWRKNAWGQAKANIAHSTRLVFAFQVLGARQLSLDTSRSPRRDHVINKYDRVRAEEELKLARLMAHLNRRRNSAQLKVDQLARDIAPRSGKKRRQDHQQFAAIETKLNEMKSHLETIDRQILEQQARKQVQHWFDWEFLMWLCSVRHFDCPAHAGGVCGKPFATECGEKAPNWDN